MRLLLALVLSAAAGCGGPPGPDAGTGEAGAGGGLPTCARPYELTGPADGTPVEVRFDTTGAEDGPYQRFATGDDRCGPTDSQPPQAIVAYTVPGSGPMAVTFSTAVPATDRTFDSVLVLRRGACDPPPPVRQTCFDDLPNGDRRARGTILAGGGEIVYAIVTGYPSTGYVDRGPITLSVSARPDRPPVIESGAFLVTPTSIRISVVGADDDADAAGVYASLVGAAGELVDVSGDGVADSDDYLARDLDRSVSGAIRFEETATFTRPAGVDLGAATEAWLSLYDEAGLESAGDVAVPVLTGDLVGLGAACGPTMVCSRELECRAGTCAGTADRAAACAAATPLAIDPPTMGVATTATASAVLMPGAGSFAGDCASTVGREVLLQVPVPMGRFDLLATTDTPGTGMGVDTVLYARTECVDPSSSPEGACHDDIDAAANRRSRIELRDLGGGDTTLFLEHYGGVPPDQTARIEVRVTLRPVLAAAEPCDPLGEMNRCAGGDCPASTRVCP